MIVFFNEKTSVYIVDNTLSYFSIDFQYDFYSKIQDIALVLSVSLYLMV